jgi:muramoyltetrapeptide carboxypeptidase
MCPPVLEGQLVAVVSPASWPEAHDVRMLRTRLESWGFRVRVGAHALDRHGYRAGSDDDRLADLNAAITDPEVRAIVTTRGGCGSFRLVRAVDAAALRADPKPLVGFSDITALHLVWQAAGVPSLHGAASAAAPSRSGWPAGSTPTGAG